MQNTILLTKEKVLRDPIHNYIYLQHQVIVDLINTREFQRLRRIKQLGTTNLTFHGAEHSRFTHSVGVYEITRRICDLFLRNYPSKSPNDGLWNDDERLVALCAALLHDLGHGAYSHTFEHIFKTNHEEMTVAIITNPETQINQVLKNVAPDFPEKVASVITKTYPNPQVVQMISSQIDADRMDYLLRDSYFTGANYGTFDLTRILRVMRPDSKGIIFDINGMHAVEDYIVSRFQMYQQVYFHPVSRSMEVILDHLLSRARHLFEEGKLNDPLSQQFLHPFFNGTFTLQNYLALDDGILNTCFELWRSHDDPVLSNLATRFLDRQPLKSVKTSMETQALLPELRQLVTDAGFDPLYYTAVNDSFDLPYDVYNPRKDKKPTQIRLRQKDGTTAELSQESALVKAITGRQSGDERFFFPKEMLAQNQNLDVFMPIYLEFAQHIKNDHIV